MFAKVLDFTRSIFEDMAPGAFQRRFLEALLAVQNVERGSLWVKRGETIACIEAAGEQSERILGVEIPTGRASVVGWVIENARMTISEPLKDPRHYKDLEQGLAAKSTLILCYPLILRDGTVYGALELIDTSAQGSRLNLRKDFLEVLEHLVGIGSIALGQALAFEHKERECRGLKTALERFKGAPPIVGRSPAVQEAMKKVHSYARTDFPVLITGESGTGKELFAQAIHQSSPRRDKPFHVQNCSAIPETLLESELFGYKKGAFTGADRDKTGLFEAASGGTVFLDEIGDMAPSLQAKILRLIQNSEIKPLGGAAARTVDVRIISATNKNLQQAMAESEFREDLFYRLNVLPLHLPPLRERREDLGELLDYFLKADCRRMGIPAKRLAASARELLLDYCWPGNIREMENVVKYILTVVEGEVVEATDLPAHVSAASPETQMPRDAETPDLAACTWEEMERAYAASLLERHRWNVSKAAKQAGLNRSTFDSRLKKLGISKI
ncbi:Nitrogen regulation protein NR(I) [Fundidesulfovibrio magnetotacticus]|uniref:Nitrogen regulation protein NR(I) n=1 Tax=Fundidesulfovibrio magnetotacticus TaxID=2730080 RepID=A0A6V8LVJ1_9BACT|nr:sigma 54-interacting transcriptional regulator [Fundidesulfovibrio magnetotacticus]GFK92265.1 Nitrogen regulation protein NR(I) [Fundidesulfovibrio magnetotacticus]